jgi:hypothetical protein
MKHLIKNNKNIGGIRKISMISAITLLFSSLAVGLLGTSQVANADTTPVITASHVSDTLTSITVTWAGTDYLSWQLTTGEGQLTEVKGNDLGGTYTWSGLVTGNMYSATLRLYSGLDQTGSSTPFSFAIFRLGADVVVPTPTPTPTPAPQVPVVPVGPVKTGDGSMAWKN